MVWSHRFPVESKKYTNNLRSVYHHLNSLLALPVAQPTRKIALKENPAVSAPELRGSERNNDLTWLFWTKHCERISLAWVMPKKRFNAEQTRVGDQARMTAWCD
jgi:hypothetical protein